MNNLKISFNNCESIEQNYSQAGQDLFVLSCLNGKRNGTFLDLGCHKPIDLNNTFLLEDKFSWEGVSIDIEKQYIDLYTNRKCVSIAENCVTLDFKKVMSYYDNSHIDYLSLDLEPASVTYQCLQNIPFENIEFSIITYEHDYYRFGDEYRTKSRNLLLKNGYNIICHNVKCSGNIFEDWYYNPKYVNIESIKALQTDSKEWKTILFKE